MSILIEDSEEVCSHCVQMRRTFILTAISAVLPILVFAALLLLVSSNKLDSPFEGSTSAIVEFTFTLLYLQLFVATSVLITSFVKKRQPILKYHFWYLVFHVCIIWMVFCSCFALTYVNEAYVLTGLVLAGVSMYYGFIYHLLRTNKYPWTALRRAY